MSKNDKDYNKQYYSKNKDRIKKMMTEKVQCDCGCIVSKCNMQKHMRTNKHKQYLQSPSSPTEEINKLKKELKELKNELCPVYVMRLM